MNKWKGTTLGEISTNISYGYTASAQLKNVGPKFLRITDIVPNRIYWDTVPYCIADTATLDKYQLNLGDIVIARTGATTGFNKTIKKVPCEAIFASYLIRYRIDETKADPYYVGYVLQSPNWFAFISAIAGGSAQPGANAKQLASYKIQLPPLSEQHAIADVLAALNDKIDLLHRQNVTLEALAQTLFRQWFVEEPEDDWKEVTLDSILTVKGGTTPSTRIPEYWNGEFHWTTPRDLSNYPHIFLFDTARKITESGLKQIGSGLLPEGTLLLSSRAPVGYLAFAEVPIAINQGYIAIIDNKGFSKYFIYCWIKENMDFVKSHAGGTTFLEISKSSFRKLVINQPPAELRAKFDQLISTTFEKIKANVIQIRTLENLLDLLLPKLMSGEVRVQEGND